MLMEGFLLMATLATGPGPALAPCPKTPNCVSTEATDAHAIAPFHYKTSRDVAMQRLLAVLRDYPRTKIVHRDDQTIRAEFRTLIFRFVDDATFVFDDSTKTIHFRSASRLGKGDLGVNRKRMEELRELFLKAQ